MQINRPLQQFFLKKALLYSLILAIILGSIYLSYQREKKIHVSKIATHESVVVKTGSTLIKDIISPIVADVDLLVRLAEQAFSAHSFAGSEEDAYLHLQKLLTLVAKNKPVYDQIRYLNSEGVECIRIDNSNGADPIAASPEKLQNKQNRYYFKDAYSLKKGETFISPVDLNIEHGKIQIPFKPMIRFGRPVYNKDDIKVGIVLINYKASFLIRKLHYWSKDFLGDLTLLNSDGYWIHAHNEKDEWGFMLPERADRSLKIQQMELWGDYINAQEEGQTQHETGLYTYGTIRPLDKNHISSSGSLNASGESIGRIAGSDYYWKILSHVSNTKIEESIAGLRSYFLLFALLSTVSFCLFVYFLLRAQWKRKLSDEALRHANIHLEETIASRTKELSSRNKQLSREVDIREKIEQALADSQEKYRSIMAAMDDGVYITSPDYTIEYVNPALSKKIIDDPIGKKCYQVLYGRKSKCPWCIYEDLLEGTSLHYESSELDNNLYHISNTLINYHENTTGKLTIFRDITDYRNTQMELRKSQEDYAILLATMKEGLLSVDENAVITYSNASLTRMLGVGKDELIGKKVVDFLDDENRNIYVQEFATRHRENAEPYELTWRNRDGLGVVTQISPAILSDSDGTFKGSLGVVSDVTEAKMVEREKRELEKQLQQAQKMEALGTLAGGIAHDFNNILAAILGFGGIASEIVRGRDDAELEEIVGEINTAGRRAAELVKQILSFARQTKQQRQPLAIEPILKEAIKLLRSATSSSVTINLTLDDNVGKVLADPTQIHQIIMNLSTNSCQAMLPSGGALNISLQKEKVDKKEAGKLGVSSGDFLCLAISDTGHGIPQEIVDKVFDPFFTTKEVGKGTGLGLSVVHSIVKDHEGAIELTTEENIGTTIRIFLPITREVESTQPLISERLLRGHGERIAWVDDEEPLTTMGCQVLNSLGYRASGYVDPGQFIDEVRSNPEQFDLIISDLNMPNINGVELFNRVKVVDPTISFILCSGYSEEVNEENAQDIGLASFLMKPVSKNDVALAVYTALRGSKTKPGR